MSMLFWKKITKYVVKLFNIIQLQNTSVRKRNSLNSNINKIKKFLTKRLLLEQDNKLGYNKKTKKAIDKKKTQLLYDILGQHLNFLFI